MTVGPMVSRAYFPLNSRGTCLHREPVKRGEDRGLSVGKIGMETRLTGWTVGNADGTPLSVVAERELPKLAAVLWFSSGPGSKKSVGIFPVCSHVSVVLCVIKAVVSVEAATGLEVPFSLMAGSFCTWSTAASGAVTVEITVSLGSGNIVISDVPG